MDKGVRFNEKLHDPKTASREELIEQVRKITRFLTLIAEDFERRIGTVYDHYERLQELVDVSREQRKAWNEGNLKEFVKAGEKATKLVESIRKQILFLFNSFDVMLREEQTTISLIMADERDLEALKKHTLEDYEMEKREYGVFFAVAKQKIPAAMRDIKQELEAEAKLIAVHERLTEILSKLPPLIDGMRYFVGQEEKMLQQFVYREGTKFDPVAREQHENYLGRMIAEIEAKLLQEKKMFYDPFNELARMEVTPVDRFAMMLSSSRRKNMRITTEDIKRIEMTMTEPEEYLMVASVLKGHEDITDADAMNYVFELMKKARRGIKEVKLKATHDLLTQIKNRYSFEADIKSIIKEKDTFSVILFDIDHFKVFNDTYGHDIGDKVLVEVASIIKKNIRTSDEAYRIGGEELVVLLPKTKLTGAAIVAENVRKAIEQHKMTDYEGKETYKGKKIAGVTLSGGIIALEDYSFLDTVGSGIETGTIIKSIMKQADILLYKAKENGRNNIQKDFYNPLFKLS